MELKISNFLQKCSLNQLKQIHAFIITTSLHQNIEVLSRFLRRSTEFGDMEYSNLVFSHLLDGHFSNQITLWNAMIRGYAFNGPFESCLAIYNEMQRRGLRPNNFTYPFVLDCCSRMRSFDLGKAVNSQVIKSGFSGAFKVSESLLHMYLNVCRCSDSSAGKIEGLSCARKLFDEMLVRPVDAWNKMISAYVDVDNVDCAQEVFEEMPERDIVSWNAIISGFIKAGDVAKARETFERMPDKNVISWTSMVAAYGSSGDLKTAREIFDNMPNRNLVSWNTMISCYTQHKKFKEALHLFVQMQSNGIDADGFTFASALTACSQLGELELGRWTRSLICDWSNLGLEVATAMIDLYAKCGHVDLAFALFLKVGKNKDVFCWNVMIKSLASHGRTEDAIKLFILMIRSEPLRPNDYTFSSVLFACSHAGLVSEGQRIFNIMETDFGVSPTIEHYGCMVDLLSRKGQLAEAFSLVEKMPFEPDVAIWGALLGGCRIWGDVKFAERVMTKLNGLKMREPGVYVSLCNAYASMGEWPQASSARHMMEEDYIWKRVGSSFVV